MKEPFFWNLAFLDGGTIVLVVFGAVVVILVLWAIGAYNGLVRLRNMYRNAFAQIDVQLKRRHDLIPNLVAVSDTHLTLPTKRRV